MNTNKLREIVIAFQKSRILFPMNSRLSVFLILYLFCVTINAQPVQWYPSGIGGGGAMFSPCVSPFNDHEYYITSDMSGIFYSTDAGDSWDLILSSQITGAGIYSKINFTSDPEILYNFGYTGYPNPVEPMRSNDAGETWSVLSGDPTGGDVYYLFADPAHEDRLIVTDYSNIYISNNGGQDFSLSYQTSNGNGIHVGGVLWDSNNIYIGTNLGFLVSDDNGGSFSAEDYTDDLPGDHGILTLTGVVDISGTVLFCVARPASDIWAGISPVEYYSEEADVYRMLYEDGNGWVIKNNGIPAEIMPYHVDMSRTNTDTVYMSGYEPSSYSQVIYKTINSGSSWTSVFITSSNQNIETGWMGAGGDLSWGWAGNTLGLGVAPYNPDVVVITDWGFAHASVDGGDTWRQVYVPADESNQSGTSTPQDQYYHSNGLEITAAWWLTWISEEDMFAGYTDITGFISHDGGASWGRDYDYPVMYNTTYQVIRNSDGKLYAAVSSVHDLYQSTYLTDSKIDNGTGEIFVSDDNGDTWSVLYDFDHPVVWIAIDPDNTAHFYASVVHSTEGGIYYSDNSGASWVKLTDPPRTEGHPFNIHVLDDGVLVCSYSGRINNSGSFTQSSGVFISTDNGQSWTDRTHTDMTRWTKDIIINPHDPQQDTWYACVFSHWGAYPNEVGGIYRTYNRGQDWERISSLYRVNSLSIHPDNPDIAFVTTADANQGLQYSADFTSMSPSFTLLEDYPFSHPLRVFFDPYDHNEVWVTSFGNGMRKGYMIPAVTENSLQMDHNVQINPNPAGSRIMIKSYIQINRLVIFDLTGKQVMCINRIKSTDFDISHLNGGMYIVEIQTNSGTEHHKFIKE